MQLMFFKNKVKRLVDPDKEVNQQDVEERLPLEKGDKAALAIAAAIVFIPALLLMCGVFIGISMLFLR